jgi:hypothetical protein
VEDERAETLGGLDPLDLRAGVVALRVLAAGDDDRHGRPRVDLEIDASEPARRGRRERSREVAVDPGHERLRLRVAEPAVELEHLWPLRGQHQPREEHAGERCPAPGQLLDHGSVDEADELLDLG